MMLRLGNNTILLALCIMLLQRGRTWALEATEQLEEHNTSLRGGRDLRRSHCGDVVCPAVTCNEGCTAVMPQGECCPQCKCKGQFCQEELCDVVDCLPGYHPYAEPGTCCVNQCKPGEGEACGSKRCEPGLICCNVSSKFIDFVSRKVELHHLTGSGSSPYILSFFFYLYHSTVES